ncbi:Pyridoxine 5'-phosphate synthase [Posidoniimonas polymericola]|uniref:Pyridoxine 5'-phosphate synthase n=1 Tax=Posidoniimonas polymericola TaxID=2528002 RepID=A0A5C5XWB9_9BACT|nr:pyridoxine 5'-phosphate synthase [Posidoniimonas polymericola]TWT66285.1 Pyridoxine 5'-phosphate synthase [Posidoniimonas polymericola]
MVLLGVNIDHVATVREARKTNEPDPVWAATLAELGGADGITLHLREDRRHIQERDLRIMLQTVAAPVNLELACTQDVLDIAVDCRPQQATLVPEKREEVTTEGGLDVVGSKDRIVDASQQLRDAGIRVSLFVDPDPAQIEASIKSGAEAIELHTGAYAHAAGSALGDKELEILHKAASDITSAGLLLHAGHGLTYRNVQPVAAIPQMRELNIGHSIISRSIMIGLQQAVSDMKRLVREAAK